MRLEEVLFLVERAGVTLTVDGEDLIARPTRAVTPEIVVTLRENKRALLSALRPIRSEAEVFELVREYFDRDDDGRRGGDGHHQGLVAAWSGEFGYVGLHDPTTGEWHDVPTKEAPGWALSEARRRKELYADGNRKAYRLSAREMEEVWEKERGEVEDEGIVEEHPVEED